MSKGTPLDSPILRTSMKIMMRIITLIMEILTKNTDKINEGKLKSKSDKFIKDTDRNIDCLLK